MTLIGLFRSTSGYINQSGFCFVFFKTYYSVECQTKSLSNLCVRFIMIPIFLATHTLAKIEKMGALAESDRTDRAEKELE